MVSGYAVEWAFGDATKKEITARYSSREITATACQRATPNDVFIFFSFVFL
jgi:hypothetical protein